MGRDFFHQLNNIGTGDTNNPDIVSYLLMMKKLYMLLVGSKPPGRFTEQHDIFFGIGSTLSEIVPQLKEFWPEAGDKLHVDGWREVNQVGDYKITVVERKPLQNEAQLYFINLGGYKPDELEEFHYKILIVAKDKGEAIQGSKQTAFYKHTGFEGATSHIDDKYGIDVDDMFAIPDILTPALKEKYSIQIIKNESKGEEDEIQLGYYKLEKLEMM